MHQSPNALSGHGVLFSCSVSPHRWPRCTRTVASPQLGQITSWNQTAGTFVFANKNTDTWFVGFTSKLVVGVYVGMDDPKPLGRYETGAKTAMPIFKDFVKNAVKKRDARPFKVAPNILMMVIEPITGKKASFESKKQL